MSAELVFWRDMIAATIAGLRSIFARNKNTMLFVSKANANTTPRPLAHATSFPTLRVYGGEGVARLPLPRHWPPQSSRAVQEKHLKHTIGLRRGIALSWLREAWPPRPWLDPELDCSRKNPV